ncbi:MAG: NAD(P) transhydrogenase subunit alpha [Desulfovibrio sp.]|nr:NAD(P) transhydrogenase subunit alpha [Desulfovibrio sp.]
MTTLILILVFIAALIIGYKVLTHIPSLLHTPLMSSMNALDGVIILGALAATHRVLSDPDGKFAAFWAFLGALGIALAITNVFGGFDITNKMLNMLAGKKRR